MVIKSGKHFILAALAFLCAVPAVINADVEILDFHARLDTNASVILEWATSREKDIDHFVIFRAADKINYIKIKELQSKQGDSSSRREYSCTDNTVFKTASGSFSYKLAAVHKDGTMYTYPAVETISVSSGIKHTWGSIKAMFR